MSRFGYQKMNKLNNFGPVYLINLKDHTDRLKNAEKEFKKYGIKNYTVIEAVDGRNNDLSEIIDGRYPRLKSSEIGCISSHIKALKYWLDTSSSEYAIIMEDDFSFDTVEYWSWDWDYVVEKLPKDYEIVQLVMIKNEPIKFSLHKKDKFDINKKSTYSWSTACYVIKRSYAQMLVNEHYIDGKYRLKNYGFKNQAADVILYNLGNAYSMPLFTHILDIKNSINSDHEEFHTRSSNFINSWWKKNAKLYSKEEFFDIQNGLYKKVNKQNICFKVFHNEENTQIMEKRNMLTKYAINQLEKDFDNFDTPTIMIKNKEEVYNFYKDSKIKINPKGWLDEGWKPGELGIWASNYTAWDNFSKSKYDSIILMEDDIQLSKSFSSKLLAYMDELPDGWDVFTVYIPKTGNMRYNKNPKNFSIGKQNICKVYQSWSCLCYVVSKSGAKKMLNDVQNPVSRPIDHYLFYSDLLNVYSIKYGRDNICGIYETESTVQTSKKEDMTGWV
jgi:GR25 family glycosyltransferase involved in LPS biosynthesis